MKFSLYMAMKEQLKVLRMELNNLKLVEEPTVDDLQRVEEITRQAKQMENACKNMRNLYGFRESVA